MNLENANKKVSIEATLLDWMAVHGNLCLALRHPQNIGPARFIVAKMLGVISLLLVKNGFLTREEMDEANNLERVKIQDGKFVM